MNLFRALEFLALFLIFLSIAINLEAAQREDE